jgi:hypothetical protein
MFVCWSVLRRALFLLTVVLCGAQHALASGGQFRIFVVDADTGEPIACRMHLKNANGKVQKVPRVAMWQDHFVFDGKLTLKLPKGTYNFELERGPEYLDRKGQFEIQDFADDEQAIEMHRAVDMAKEGWWAGDLDIHRTEKDIKVLMQAEDLHVAPLITWTNDKNAWAKLPLPKDPIVKFDSNRYYDLLGGEDDRAGSALLFFNLKSPLELPGAKEAFPPSSKILMAAAANEGVWIDAARPFSADLPIWLASRKINSIGIANSHMQRDKMRTDEAGGRGRDKRMMPDPRGNGQWSEAIYHRVLETGLRIPPSAGSASGVAANPVGYNRVYVQVDKSSFDYATWWRGFQLGRVMVTNGPLIVNPAANGRPPGHVFSNPAGEELDLELTLSLTTRDPISYLEIVQNGRVAHTVRLDELAKNGKLPKVHFAESGWVLVRAATDVEPTHRFASTGPWYVDIGEKNRVSKSAAQFFLDWLADLTKALKLDDPQQQAESLKYHNAARKFWEERLKNATVD